MVHLFAIWGLLVLLLMGRLAQVQLFQGNFYSQKAQVRMIRWDFIRTRRGRILDRKGVIIAQDQGVFHLTVVPAELDPSLRLALILGGSRRLFEQFQEPPKKGSFPFHWGEISPQKASQIVKAKERDPLFASTIELQLKEEGIELFLRKSFFEKKRELLRRLSNLLLKPLPELERKWQTLVKKVLSTENAFERKVFLESPQTFESSLSPEVAHKIEIALLPGVYISTASRRLYPHRRETWHMVGYLGPLNRKEFLSLKKKGQMINFARFKNRDLSKVRPFLQGGYFLDEQIGKRGLEKTFEKTLRGWKGLRVVERDYRNKAQNILSMIPPKGGEDLVLTLDFALQKSLFNEFDRLEGEVVQGNLKTISGHVSGASVALDPSTGEILALLSYPPFSSTHKELFPYFNRPLAGRYPPGSIFKPLVALAFLETREVKGKPWKVTLADEIFCTGRLGHSPFFKCLGHHGSTNLIRALKKSCNIYFYRFGEKLGGEGLYEWGCRFGLNEGTNIELAGEKVGLLPSPQWKEKRWGQRWWPGDSRNFAIGQGYLTVTPLGICRALASLFNGGRVLKVHLLKGKKAKVLHNLSFSPSHLEAVQEGMRQVLEPGGSAHRSGVEVFQAAAKTGSAQDGKGFNFAWIAGAAWGSKGRGSYPAVPPIVFVVMVEHTSGHGGDTAGPIAAKMLHTFFSTR